MLLSLYIARQHTKKMTKNAFTMGQIVNKCILFMHALISQPKQTIHDVLHRWDIFRYVESDVDPVTGEDRIWHVYDKGELPGWMEEERGQ